MIWSPVSSVPVIGARVSCFFELDGVSARAANRLLDEAIEKINPPSILRGC